MSPKLDLEFLPIPLTWGWGMKRTGEPAHGAVSTSGHCDSSGQLQWLVVVHTHPQIPAGDSCPVAVSHSPLSLIQSEWQLWLLFLHQPLPHKPPLFLLPQLLQTLWHGSHCFLGMHAGITSQPSPTASVLERSPVCVGALFVCFGRWMHGNFCQMGKKAQYSLV